MCVIIRDEAEGLRLRLVVRVLKFHCVSVIVDKIFSALLMCFLFFVFFRRWEVLSGRKEKL